MPPSTTALLRTGPPRDVASARRSGRQRSVVTGPGVALGLIALVPLAFLTVFFLLPVGGMLARGFLPGGQLDLSGIPTSSGAAGPCGFSPSPSSARWPGRC